MKNKLLKTSALGVLVASGFIQSISFAHASIISTEVSVGMSVRYKNSPTGIWLTDVSGSSSGATNASIDITGSATDINLYSNIDAVVNSPDKATVTFDLGRNGSRTGLLTTSGYPDAVWGNVFQVSYYADTDSVLRYSWEIEAPSMLNPAPNWAMADVLVDLDQDLNNGFLQRIQSTNTPDTYIGSSDFNLFSGFTYEFFVTMYHYQSFAPDYDISSQMDAKFWFDFSNNNVPEPSTIALFGLGLAGIGFTQRKKRTSIRLQLALPSAEFYETYEITATNPLT